MTRRKANLGLRLLAALAGVAMLGFSIAAMFWADIGSDPTSVLVDGLHRALNITHGNASNLVNIALLVLLALVDYRKLGASTAICALTLGSFIALSQRVFFDALPADAHFAVRLWVCLGAIGLNGMGLGLYINADLGTSAFDGIILSMHQKWRISRQNAMYCFYAVVFVIGAAVGGVWGLGTLLSLLLCGVVFEFFLRFFQKILGPRLLPGGGARILASGGGAERK